MSLPPLHPILVNFTAALVPISLFSDVLGRVLRKPSLTSAGWWTLFYATLITPLTVLAGWYWFKQMSDMDHSQMALHKWLGTALIPIFTGLLYWRWKIHRTDRAPDWSYLMCEAIVVGALMLQGHLGGTMSFGLDEPTTSSKTSSEGQSPAGIMTMPMGSYHAPDSSPASMPSMGIQWKDHIDLRK